MAQKRKNEVMIKLFGKMTKEILVISIKEIVFKHIFYKSMQLVDRKRRRSIYF